MWHIFTMDKILSIIGYLKLFVFVIGVWVPEGLPASTRTSLYPELIVGGFLQICSCLLLGKC